MDINPDVFLTTVYYHVFLFYRSALLKHATNRHLDVINTSGTARA
jgi:hypothetical protein